MCIRDRDNTLEILGVVEIGTTVEIFQDGIPIGTVQATSEGTFTFDHTATVLPDSTYTFTATATDATGNTSEISNPLQIEINTLDTDGDGLFNFCDEDDDNDGIPDLEDDFPLDAEPTPVVAQAFTPNGDNINDFWVIQGLSNYPGHIVRVFNRDGAPVFEAQNYTNNWNGAYKGNSRTLPSGSYFYTIDLGNGQAPMQGWIFINN